MISQKKSLYITLVAVAKVETDLSGLSKPVTFCPSMARKWLTKQAR
jgi:hypothetical protein